MKTALAICLVATNALLTLKAETAPTPYYHFHFNNTGFTLNGQEAKTVDGRTDYGDDRHGRKHAAAISVNHKGSGWLSVQNAEQLYDSSDWAALNLSGHTFDFWIKLAQPEPLVPAENFELFSSVNLRLRHEGPALENSLSNWFWNDWKLDWNMELEQWHKVSIVIYFSEQAQTTLYNLFLNGQKTNTFIESKINYTTFQSGAVFWHIPYQVHLDDLKFWKTPLNASLVSSLYELEIINPGPLDTDSDGINDTDEYSLVTDPYNSDTDGDGFSDGIELSQGSNPTDGKEKPSQPIINKPRELVDGLTIKKAIQLNYTTSAQYSYSLESSSDLKTWTKVIPDFKGNNRETRFHLQADQSPNLIIRLIRLNEP